MKSILTKTIFGYYTHYEYFILYIRTLHIERIIMLFFQAILVIKKIEKIKISLTKIIIIKKENAYTYMNKTK